MARPSLRGLVCALLLVAARATRDSIAGGRLSRVVEPDALAPGANEDSSLLNHKDGAVREAAWRIRAVAEKIMAAEEAHDHTPEGLTVDFGALDELLLGLGSASPAETSPRSTSGQFLHSGKTISSLAEATPDTVAMTSSSSQVERIKRSESEGEAVWFEPASSDLEDVVSWIGELAEAAKEDPEDIVNSVRSSPAGAAAALARLAESARISNDGVDRDKQAFYHLVEIKVQDRIANSGLSMTSSVIKTLAQDYREIKRLQTPPEGLNLLSEDEAPEGPNPLITSYAHGIAMKRMSNKERPHVLIFTCSYGDGHISASHAVAKYLQEDSFRVKIVDTAQDPKLKVGVAAMLGIDVSKLYNDFILKEQWYRLHNLYDQLTSYAFGRLREPCPSPKCNTAQKDRLREIILAARPDLIVTVYHMDLLPILEVAKDLGNLPMLHVPTDMDLKMSEVFGKDGPAAIYPRFLVAAPFNNSMSLERLMPLSEERSFIAGYPVRTEFLQTARPSSLAQASQKLAFPEGTRVVLVMSGGGGQASPIPEKLAAQGMDIPLHLVVIVGRNKGEGERLLNTLEDARDLDWAKESRKVRKGVGANVTLEVAVDPSNTDAEAPYYVGPEMLVQLMDRADAIITKPGGGTSAEVAYRGLPALFDKSNGPLLHWEEFTVEIFESLERGFSFETDGGLQINLKRAFNEGRSTELAADPKRPGFVLNTAANLRMAARSLMAEECVQCTVFP